MVVWLNNFISSQSHYPEVGEDYTFQLLQMKSFDSLACLAVSRVTTDEKLKLAVLTRHFAERNRWRNGFFHVQRILRNKVKERYFVLHKDGSRTSPDNKEMVCYFYCVSDIFLTSFNCKLFPLYIYVYQNAYY